jgi:hypothetical protein
MNFCNVQTCDVVLFCWFISTKEQELFAIASLTLFLKARKVSIWNSVLSFFFRRDKYTLFHLTVFFSKK